MKTAVVALTANGAVLAQKIGAVLPADIFIKAGRHPLNSGNVKEFVSLKPLVKAMIYQYDAVIFIMAAGIAVRMIAPYIVHKTMDPAVVVIDELGVNVISLLSGHIGGANTLTRRIAGLIGGNPVITTATDVNEKLAADVIAGELGLRIGQIAGLKQVNADIVAGEEVSFYIDIKMPTAAFYVNALKKRRIYAELVELTELKAQGSTVVITERQDLLDSPNILFLSPGKLTAGIGCRRGTTDEEILFALTSACRQVDKQVTDVISLASTVVKSDEIGLLTLAGKLEIPIYFFEHEQIQTVIDAHHLASSDFVHQQIGVGNICESTAILSSQSKKLILRKTKYPKVTIALAWAK